MVRPLRIEYPGGVYHITSRGNARRPIFLSDTDRQSFLDVIASVVKRFNWFVHEDPCIYEAVTFTDVLAESISGKSGHKTIPLNSYHIIKKFLQRR